ncbi:sugar phosphate isomerase/epimerase family protein [uncultured Sphaerochaeta sp.]|uniref:sugar phosphate isomerase/epimerase family protein n=1 Tax=uncultured Sphaerochaeta sp. TaxID=886478 RepID=UPI002A0A756F|nr:sugar phosphate isomerase/epimerase family protein [uncultured Sphaerochaeta sp.]
MQQPIIGINLPRTLSFEALDTALDTIKTNGFDAVEINIETFPLIIGGEICRPWVDVLKASLQKHDLSYSAHIGRGLDLRNLSNPQLHKRVLNASLDICAELKLNPLVLHYEVQSQNQLAEKQFLEAHREAAKKAMQLGLTICVENIEVELVEPVVQLVETINHPNLRLNLDTGHAFLAAHYFHFDFLKAVERMVPLLGHMHLNDNTGTFEELRITNRPTYDGLSMNQRREFGRGDIHLPPYFGTVPFKEVFARIPQSYHGKFICEYTSEAFGPLNAGIQQEIRKKILESRKKA